MRRFGMGWQSTEDFPVSSRRQLVLSVLPVDRGQSEVDIHIVRFELSCPLKSLSRELSRAQMQIGGGKVGEVDAVLWAEHGGLDEARQSLPIILLGKLSYAERLERPDIVRVFLQQRLAERLSSVELSHSSTGFGFGQHLRRMVRVG